MHRHCGLHQPFPRLMPLPSNHHLQPPGRHNPLHNRAVRRPVLSPFAKPPARSVKTTVVVRVAAVVEIAAVAAEATMAAVHAAKCSRGSVRMRLERTLNA